MHIFIDESGLFSVTTKSPAWSTVGAVAIPSESLSLVETALNLLKSAHNVAHDVEFKQNRPDCSSEPYQKFLTSLDQAGCTLHALSTVSIPGLSNDDKVEAHRSATVSAIENYALSVNELTPHAETVVKLVKSLSIQEYNQCMLQSQMISDMLPKIISHYAENFPHELGSFKWIIDRKNITENKYERCFKELYMGLVKIRSIRQTASILGNRDYSYFFNSFVLNSSIDDLLNEAKKMTGTDQTHLKDSIIPFSYADVLAKEFSLEDSKINTGLQVADLLISSVNRCLKRNYSDNDKMAKSLGKLMVNSPRINEYSLKIMGHQTSRPVPHSIAKLITIMDNSSKKLYNQNFRKNFSKNLPLF